MKRFKKVVIISGAELRKGEQSEALQGYRICKDTADRVEGGEAELRKDTGYRGVG